MANTKISGLSSASTPLTGSEVVPLNQSSVSDSVSVANLTAGRAVSAASLTLSTGNVTQGASGTGYNFTANTPAAGMTSQLLNWYEEGTWTPSLSFGGAASGVTYGGQLGYYTRIGRVVYYSFDITLTSKGTSIGSAVVSGLPFTASNLNSLYPDGVLRCVTALVVTAPANAPVLKNTTTIGLFNYVSGSQVAITNTAFSNNTEFTVTGFYFI